MPKFDPMTGEPIEDLPETTQENVAQETETTQGVMVMPTPVQQMPKKNNYAKIVIPIVAGVVLLFVIAFGVFASGIFSSPKKKIEKAFINTLTDGGYIYDLLTADFKLGDNYTVEATVEMEEEYSDVDLEVSAALAVKGKDKQLSGVVNYSSLSDYLPEIEFISQIDSKQVKLAIPSLSDRVFTYNYVEEKDGFLVDSFDEEIVKILDEALKTLYSPEKTAETLTGNDELSKSFKKWYKDLKITKTRSEEFEIDDKDRTCKGYEMILTEDDLLDLLDILDDYYEEQIEELVDLDLDLDLDDYRSMIRELRSDLKGMDDIELRFYLYKNQLAAIEIEIDREELQILFKGGNYRMQNVEVVFDRETVMELKGKIKDDKETMTLYEYDEEIARVSYNKKTGDVRISVTDGWSSYDFSGNIVKKNNELTIALDETQIDALLLSGSVTLKKGAKFDKLKGEEFDIGNADEDDWEDLGGELEEKLEDVLY